MSFKVTFTNKDGTPGSSTFGSERMANAYAKTVKNGKVVPVETAAPEVSVKACPVGTAEAQRAASKDFYLTTKRGERYVPEAVREAQASERRAERMMEHFNDYHMAGVSREDAWADWDSMQGGE